MQVRSTEQLLDLMVGAARFELATTCTPFSSMILQTFLSTTYVHASAAICLTMLNNAQLMDTKLTQQFCARCPWIPDSAIYERPKRMEQAIARFRARRAGVGVTPNKE